jgi:hypothetical protein
MIYFEFFCDKTSVLDGLAALDEGLDEGCKLDVPRAETATLVGGQRYLHLYNRKWVEDSVADPGCLSRSPKQSECTV